MADIDTSYPLTPSEIAFINADQFVRTARLGYKPVGSETTVVTNDLARLVLTVALLALEAAGEITLEYEEKKVLLVTARQLTVRPVGNQTGFAEPSVESQLHALAIQRGSGDKGIKVKDLVYRWIGGSDSTPHIRVLDRFLPNLHARGLLDENKEKKLKIITVVNYALRDETRRYALEADIASVKSLLSRCEEQRPEVWKQLTNEVERAIQDRDSSSDDFD
ncbi:MAG: hypothetical protein PVF18_04060 [Anaerolineales bacterium]|jgi:hypothetical protein